MGPKNAAFLSSSLTHLGVDLVDGGGLHGQELRHLVELFLLALRDDAVVARVGGERGLVQLLGLLRDDHVRDLFFLSGSGGT